MVGALVADDAGAVMGERDCGPGFVWHDELARCVLPKSRPTLGWHEDPDDFISPHIIDVYEQEFIPDPERARYVSNLLDSIRPARMYFEGVRHPDDPALRMCAMCCGTGQERLPNGQFAWLRRCIACDGDGWFVPGSVDGVRNPEPIHERHTNAGQQEEDEQAGHGPEQGAPPGLTRDAAHDPGDEDERGEQDSDGHTGLQVSVSGS